MKKLLAVLFVLGAVSAMGESAVETSDKCLDWDAKGCAVEKDFNIEFKVPKKLEISVKDVPLGLWCGTVAKNYTTNFGQHTITGEPDQQVSVAIKNGGAVTFKEQGVMIPHTVNGTVQVTQDTLTLTGGTASGEVEVHLPKPATSLHAGRTYKGHATLQVGYLVD